MEDFLVEVAQFFSEESVIYITISAVLTLINLSLIGYRFFFSKPKVVVKKEFVETEKLVFPSKHVQNLINILNDGEVTKFVEGSHTSPTNHLYMGELVFSFTSGDIIIQIDWHNINNLLTSEEKVVLLELTQKRFKKEVDSTNVKNIITNQRKIDEVLKKIEAKV